MSQHEKSIHDYEIRMVHAAQKVSALPLPRRDDDPTETELPNGMTGQMVMQWIITCATPLNKLIIAVHCGDNLTDDQLSFLYEELPWPGRPDANEQLCRLARCTKDNPRAYDTSDK